jgi:hypothetical protein
LDDPTGTWFLIWEAEELPGGEFLAEWDTSVLTDGNYRMRFVVFLGSGEQLITYLEGIRIRNYRPIETSTPANTSTPLPPAATPAPTLTPTPTRTPIPPTGTPLPANPAQLSEADIHLNLGRGALGAAALFLIFGLYHTLSRLFRW